MNNPPLFSILIANYNNGHYFKDCYKSIISQTYINWECIIVDDKSTDDSIIIINNLIGNDERFKLYENLDNTGVGYTKKKCIDLCSGELFGFLDPDDALEINALEVSVDFHMKNPFTSLTYSNLVICDENLKTVKIRQSKQVINNDKFFMNLTGEIGHFTVCKKEIYDQTEGLNTFLIRAIDQDLYLKMYEKGLVHHIDEKLYFYRIHKRGISLFDNKDKAYYWFWVVLNKTAERRKINLEDEFLKKFVRKYRYDDLNNRYNKLFKNRWIKLGLKLGLIRNVK